MNTVILILSFTILMLGLYAMSNKSFRLNIAGLSVILVDIMLTYPFLKSEGYIDYVFNLVQTYK